MTDIETIMKKMNMSSAEFCRTFNIPQRTLRHWIKGDRTPPPYVIKLLMEIANKTQK